ncbi:MAG: amidophosphoribosyltransferase [Candidatus Methanoperedens nitroreducens]|uniref:Amidophosphoribosyltransferase n=1 Tax=Candidatus Methanoperedens nitratireducens TaxID=1392998 RepID=A0A0P8DX70_9EURY|nr:amidophosphoribosyltransferase [Candidatus Methanoperedens sp. BLZ2]KAB2945906.1 MAG: amidophosphoribosyltransferase [Candidatus Methanoperedens sp.]KPQ42285.1 MAG: amidophosphoribosyltransferase [Candidatus Methanoperedens sp. BLZ1]MBZ0174358.1 amidophosphoribosyltransferase [Candidatus Methanoperedens nitroreducens]MCX9079891.1 amidophosphoribosyltransferase [Candidatus Methanoperedens sp.]MCX9087755.1 amidophosphoribosyltransferase [Candidatus Methanoperedens sp.]
MHEECGIVGVSFKEETSAALSIYYALFALQHRGQESAGITVHDGSQVRTLKGMGLVPDVFNKADIQKLKGHVGIGHVRYSTTGSSKIENCQPLLVSFKSGTIAIAHNGNLVNSKELRTELEKEGRIFLSESDTEVIAHLLVKELMHSELKDAVKDVIKQLVGSYSLAILIDKTVIVIRDPLGIKPLCFGSLDNGYVVASESVAIDILNGQLIRDVAPGEMLVFNNGTYESHQLVKSKNTAHCVFEYIYFARPDSVIDGQLVYNVRMRIGEMLFKEHPAIADIVSPVPDSGITYAIGFSKKSGIDYMEGLMKNRYIGRTFIMPGQDMRETAVRLKLNTIKPNIEGKSIVLIDDSIVRGTTSRRIIDMVRKSGTREIHMRVASPPIISPCYLGIDMATREELIAAHKTVKGVEALINADSLGYLSIDGLVESIGIPMDDLCLGCLSGIYPVEIPGEKCIKRQLKLSEF